MRAAPGSFRHWTGAVARAAVGSPRRRTLTALVAGVATALAVVGGSAAAAFTATTASQLTTVNTTTYPCFTRSPADSPYFYWAYNEASGTSFTDSSGNNRGAVMLSGTRTAGTCIANASPVFTTTATSGGAFLTYTTAPPTDITIETWFKTAANGTTGGGRMIGYGNMPNGSSTTYDRVAYMDNAGHVCFEMNFGNPASICTGSTYNDGTWHLVDVSVVGGNAQGARVLYIDGVSQATGVSARTSSSYGGYWRVGSDAVGDLQTAGNSLNTASGTSANSGPTNTSWPGSLDNTAVYSAILTQTQVTAHFNNSKNAR
ncbi:LamG-like jellyroll fold domain-containing protein [uncultured Amnibacterium sp.]|uniref:LamG-like jellyroll fold domain-containing protein n=1 Tax=uncultured Amnibacterium sp. TaxID=1631851 RepID=UPI0035CA1952